MKHSKEIQGGATLRLEGLQHSLKTAERRLSNYILSHPEQVIHLTIQDLAACSGSSYATIIRLCKKAGFSGFREFKSSLVQEILIQRNCGDITTLLPIHSRDTVEEIIEKTFQHSYKTLDDTRSILDRNTLKQAIDKLIAADEILFIGTGTSGVSAQYAFSRFFRIGKKCEAETDPTIYKIRAGLMDKADVLFAISSSGRSVNVVNAARLARENGASVISLCDFAVSPLTQNATVKLFTTKRDTKLFLNLDMPLIIGQITLIDALFFSVCRKMGKSAFDLMHRTKRTADQEKIN